MNVVNLPSALTGCSVTDSCDVSGGVDHESASLGKILHNVMVEAANAISEYASRLDGPLLEAAHLINKSGAPLIVAGLGKSGHIGRKIAATFCSLGKPAVFLHGAEASHGDLGVISLDSVVLVLSNSGETGELADLLYYCNTYGNPIVALTGNPNSTLASHAQVVLSYGKVKEACVNGLAPTTSTTVTLAIGDALAVGVSHLMQFAPEDFRRYHPGGKLGSRLQKVRSLMKTGADLPLARPDLPMTEAAVIMSEKRMGSVLVVEDGRTIGIVTDGDMRRNMDRLWDCTVRDVASVDPIRINPDMLALDALQLMTEEGITTCVVEDAEGRLVGLVHMLDCLSAGAQ